MLIYNTICFAFCEVIDIIINMNIHVLSIPMYPTQKEITLCAFVQKVYKFCDFMKKRGHKIIHYGHPDSKVNCDLHIDVISRESHFNQYKGQSWKELLPQEVNNDLHKEFNERAGKSVCENSEGENDIVCAFWGFGHSNACEYIKKNKKGIIVESSIGYDSCFAENRVYESYAQMHKMFGIKGEKNPSFSNQVIQPCFYFDDFEYKEKKEDYFLFLGRIIDQKGVQLAQGIANMTKTKIKFVGPHNTPNSLDKSCKYSEFINTVSTEERKSLLSNAKCLIAPTLYVEPCGWIIMEAMLSGTPVITTDWGGFTEYNKNGLTGYRCKSLNEFLHAAQNIDQIKSSDCRKYAEKTFNSNLVSSLYENYFELLINGFDFVSNKCNFTISKENNFFS